MGIVREIMYDAPGGEIVYELVTDEAELHNQNDELKKDPSRGFTKGRTMQHIGSVPCHVWHAHARKIGYYTMDNESRKKEIIKFLNQFRQWSPVESIRSEQPSEGHIIIK